MEEKIKESKYKWVTFLAGSILVILYMSFCALIFGISFTREIPIPNIANEFSTPTTAIEATPQFLFEVPKDNINNVFDNFKSNYRDWGLYYQFGKVEIINEKMIVQSGIEGVAVASNENFIKPSNTYYLQTELTTDIMVENQQYGLIFGLNKSDNNFYLFEISPEYQMFRLYKFAPSSDYQISNFGKQTSNDWILLIDYTDADINPYPQENIVGVFFEKGNIELFINGNLVGTYIDDRPLQFSGVGVFVNNSGYRLIVDNFFGYSE